MSIRPHCRPMDELAQARIQLVRLEQQERNLLGRLKDIRSAVQLQQATIDALVKSINCAPISRLPTELLLEILDLAINAAPVGCDLHLHTRKWELTCVSRRWRDVILNSPVLWTSIKLTPTWDVSVVKAHVTRSRGRPLDIEVGQSWPSRGRDALPAQLDVVVPSAHRWRSLVIHNSAGYTLSTHVLARIDNLKLSSLKHVSIPLYPPTLREQDEGKLCYPSFLRPGYISNLKSLELRNFVAPNDFQIPHGLTALLLKLPDVRPSGSSTFLSSLSSQTLKDLSLSGDIDHWSLQPDTIHLPFLEKLELRVSKAKGLLEALVAPRLINFEYHPYRMQDPPSVVFRGLSSKFRSVEYLSFHLWEILEDLYEDANAFCKAFPGVRHAQLHPADIPSIFLVGDVSCAADHWAHLESLTFKGLTRDLLRTPNEFFMWLEQRKARGKPMLHIKLSQIQGDDWGLDVSWLSTLYEALHNFSILEFEDVPLMPTVMLSGNVDSTLQLVGTLGGARLTLFYCEEHAGVIAWPFQRHRPSLPRGARVPKQSKGLQSMPETLSLVGTPLNSIQSFFSQILELSDTLSLTPLYASYMVSLYHHPVVPAEFSPTVSLRRIRCTYDLYLH